MWWWETACPWRPTVHESTEYSQGRQLSHVQELSQPQEGGYIYKFCGSRKQHVHGGLMCMRVWNTLKADSFHIQTQGKWMKIVQNHETCERSLDSQNFEEN